MALDLDAVVDLDTTDWGLDGEQHVVAPERPGIVKRIASRMGKKVRLQPTGNDVEISSSQGHHFKGRPYE